MIKLEKNFIGEVCENCNMLQAYTCTMCVDSLDSVDRNIIVNVGCENHDICYNALEQARKIRLKEKEND